MSIIDISVPLQNGLVVWPNDRPLEVRRLRSLEHDKANVSEICISSHSGTHVDPARHFLADGRTVDQLPLDILNGPADVADFCHVERMVTAADLDAAALPADCRRLLLRTTNSRFWAEEGRTFRTDYVGLSPDGAEWIVRRGIQLVGIDYLSVEPYRLPGHPVHKTLLQADVILLETLNLSAVSPGRYQLICLPLLIAGGDGAPARAALATL